MDLGAVFHQILTEYPEPSDLGESDQERSVSNFPELQTLFSEKIPSAITEAISKDQLEQVTLNSGFGDESIQHIPYIALLQPDETVDTQRGIYVAYLVDPITESLYITLNQGVTEAQETASRSDERSAVEILEAHANQYRESLQLSNRWTLGSATLSERLSNSREHNAGTICYIEYSKSDLEGEDQIIADLEEGLAAYDRLLGRLYQWPEFDMRDRQVWRLNPKSNTQWALWRAYNIATLKTESSIPPGEANSIEDIEKVSTPDQQAYHFEENIKTGDIIIAGTDDSSEDLIYGLGRVTVAFRGTFQDEVREDLKDDVELAGNRFLRVIWYPVGETGFPVTIRSDTQLYDIQKQLEVPPETGRRLLGAVARRTAAAGRASTPEGALQEVASALGIEIPVGPPEGELLKDSVISETAPFYWVDQSKQGNEAPEILQAPRQDQWLFDLQKLDKGDIVIHYRNSELIGYSEVETPAYLHRDEQQREYRRVDVSFEEFERPVPIANVFEYLRQPEIRLEEYYPIQPTGVNTEGYLYNLSQPAGEFLLRQAGTGPVQKERLESRLQFPGISFDIDAVNLYYPEEDKYRVEQQINAALNAGKHIIFTGPPGTGKSRLARAICEQAQRVGNDDWIDGYSFTTATAEWTTFDTIGGYVPDPGTDGNRLTFDERLFLSCFRDEDGTLHNEWLVIDELNRADIDKAFGELFSVLSQDSVELPYKRDQSHGDRVRIEWVDADTPLEKRQTIAEDPDRYPVTPAWRLLGTMNTFDKTSLYELSFAFMRRFSFVHVGIPSLFIDQESRIVTAELLDPAYGPNYATVWGDDDGQVEAILANRHDELALLWGIINRYRPIGPAITLDIVQHLAALEGADESDALTSAVSSLIFPQLEGLRQADYEELRADLKESGYIQHPDGATAEIDLQLDIEALWRTASDMFQLD